MDKEQRLLKNNNWPGSLYMKRPQHIRPEISSSRGTLRFPIKPKVLKVLAKPVSG